MKKRFFGIPVVVVLVLALVMAMGGVAGALTGWFGVTGGTADVTVDEAITIANAPGDGGEYFDGNNNWTVSLYPGEMKALFILVTNASSAPLDVVATYTIDPAGAGLTVTGNAGIALDIPVTLPGNSSGVFAIELHAAGNANPGSYTVNFDLHRK